MSVRYRSGPLPPLAEPTPPSADGVIASAFDQGRPHGPWHAHALRRSASGLVRARTRRDRPKLSSGCRTVTGADFTPTLTSLCTLLVLPRPHPIKAQGNDRSRSIAALCRV